MSAFTELINGCFAGNRNPLGRILYQKGSATSPNGVVTAKKGTFLVIAYPGDDSDGDAFINTDGSTTWAQIHNPVA